MNSRAILALLTIAALVVCPLNCLTLQCAGIPETAAPATAISHCRCCGEAPDPDANNPAPLPADSDDLPATPCCDCDCVCNGALIDCPFQTGDDSPGPAIDGYTPVAVASFDAGCVQATDSPPGLILFPAFARAVLCRWIC
jgi:hypothetical protein